MTEIELSEPRYEAGDGALGFRLIFRKLPKLIVIHENILCWSSKNALRCSLFRPDLP